MHGPSLARRTHLDLQTLEARDNPAGTVKAVLSGTTLTITGDDDNNAIQLTVTPGGIEVAGLNGTAITGGTQPFANVTAIKAAMGDGDDGIFLDPASDLSLAGVSTFDLGGGDNQLQLSGNKLSLGGLTVLAGDGQDLVTIDGGFGLGSAIKGNLTLALGIGKNSQEGLDLETKVSVANLDVLGAGGLKLTGAEGDEFLNLSNVNVKAALHANGGDGALQVTADTSRFGSVTLSSVGPASGSTVNGTVLIASEITVPGAVNLKSNSGVDLELTDGSTGNITTTSGPDGTNVILSGNLTVKGNVTVKGVGHSLGVGNGADVTVTGDVVMTATNHASLQTVDGSLKARNVTLTGVAGGSVDYFAHESTPGGTVPLLTTTGSVTLRGREVQYIHQAGLLNIGTSLNLIGTEDTTYSMGLGVHEDVTIANTTVKGPVLMTGRHVEYSQTESTATYKAGVTVRGTESASVSLLPWQLDGDPNNPGSPPFGDGATVSVAGTFAIKGRDANYTQKEGVATFGGLTIQATESASFDSEPKDHGFDPNGADVFGLGGKTTVTGPLTITGRSAQDFQADGEASFGGVSVVAKGGASLRTESGDVETPFGAKFTVTGTGNVLVQGGDSELIFEDGVASVGGALTVRGAGGAQFRLDMNNTSDQGNLNVGGAMTVDGGTGEVMFGGFGNSLEVGGDVSIAGAGLNRIWFDSAAGSRVGGNVKAAGATGHGDWFLVGADLTVAGNTSVSLGGGPNAIEFGVGGGTVQLEGNVTLTTGNGSDIVNFSPTTVGGTTTINTGAGADRVHFLTNTVFNGTVNVDLGGGADTFEAALPLTDPFESPVPAGPVAFNAAARVQMGTGNDTLRLGVAGDPDGKVLFGAGGTLFVDGGLNLNLFDDEAGQFDASKVSTPNFTDPTP